MSLKEKWKEKKAEWRYLFALRMEGKAHMKYLESVNEIQSFGRVDACFDGYPEIVPTCNDCKLDCKCVRKTCPLYPLNHAYVDAKKEYEESRTNRYQAETAMIAAKVRE